MTVNKPEIPNRKEMERTYESKRECYENILFNLLQHMRENIGVKSFNPAIKARIKSFDSYYDKLLKKLNTFEISEKALLINDKLGLRIICPFQENLEIIESVIKENYELLESEHKGIEHSFKEFGYSAIHFLIKVPTEILSQHKKSEELICEVQVCTALQDAWAEVEHSLFYKTEFSPFDEPLKRKLAALNANLTLSDILFQEILEYQKKLKTQLKKRREAFFNKVEEAVAGFDYDLLALDRPDLADEKKNSHLIPEKIAQRNGEHNIDNLLMEALEAHNNNKFSKAIIIYTQILKYNLPENIKVIVFLHRGMANFAESDYTNSISDFSNALELDKNNYKSLYYRGIVNKVNHNYQSALKDLSLCIKINPYRFYPSFNRAQVYFEMNDYTKALEDCNASLRIEPDSIEAKKLKDLIKSRMD